MPNPATPADVESRWRPLSDQERINAETFLEDGWRILKRRVTALETRLAATGADDLRADVIATLANAALGVLKNPDGSKREGIDDGTWEPNQAVASGLLVITDAQLADLEPAAPGHARGAYVVSLGG